MGPARTSQRRTRQTWLLYASQGVLGFSLNGLGSILLPLQRDLGVGRSAVAYYPLLVAGALVLIGLAGARIARHLSGQAALAAGLGSLGLGAVLLALPDQPITAFGGALLGLGCASLIQVVPMLQRQQHGDHALVALAEANAVSSLAALLPGLLVGVLLHTRWGWRAGYVLPIAVVATCLIVVSQVSVPARGHTEPSMAIPAGTGRGTLLGAWVDVFLAVSVEFCCVFWAADAFDTWHHASEQTATSAAVAFLAGMAFGRALGSRFTPRYGHRRLVLTCVSTAGLGFALFWGSPSLALSALGLCLTGCGIALLYPACLNRLMGARPGENERTSALGALASGTAIGVLPVALPLLAGASSLRIAYLIVPATLTMLAAHTLLVQPAVMVPRSNLVNRSRQPYKDDPKG